MPRTPKRNSSSSISSPGFIKIELRKSPAASKKNLTGSPRVAKDIIADVYNAIQHWNDRHLIGANLVKAIAITKNNDLVGYSIELEEQIGQLYKIVQTMSKYREAFSLYTSQFESLSALEQHSEPPFMSMTIGEMSSVIKDITKAYHEEYLMKEYILENIAHVKTKDGVMFLAAAWTYQSHLPNNLKMKLEALLLEVGHKKIT